VLSGELFEILIILASTSRTFLFACTNVAKGASIVFRPRLAIYNFPLVGVDLLWVLHWVRVE